MRLASAGRSALVLLLALAAVTSASGSAAQEPSRFEQALAAAERALERGELESARAEVQRALERDGKSARAWELCARVAAKAGARDEEIYSRHRELELVTAQDPASAAIAGRRAALIALDPQAEMLFGLRAGLIAELEPLAAEYEKGGRAHSAIGVHREILALAPEHAASGAAIARLSALPDPSLAEHAEPRDLLADVSAEWIREFDADHATWDERAVLEGANYNVHTNAGYEVLVRCSEAMEQMNAFYREFFQYRTDGGSVPKIDLLIFKRHDEYLKRGSGPPAKWSGGQFTGGSVETDAQGGFSAISGTLFHEAAHQFVSLATNAAGWLNEGLASFFEGCRLQANGTVLMNLPATHRLLPLVERLEAGWMRDAADGLDPENPEVVPERAPTLRIVIENAYEWGPAWYAPTWGVVYFLYNYQDPLDGRFVYRQGLREFIDKSGGRVGPSAVENFEKIVLANPAKPYAGAEREGQAPSLPRTAEECDQLWKAWLLDLRDRQIGRAADKRPYHEWARRAAAAKETATAIEHFEKGLLEAPEDVDLLRDFAELLIDAGEPDRASVLLARAARALESAAPVDAAALKAIDAKLVAADPRRKDRARLQQRLWTQSRAVVEGYAAAELPSMVMHVSQRLSSELGVPGLTAAFETALRASPRGLDTWELVYDEATLDGWGASDDTFRAAGPLLESHFGTYSSDAYDFRLLTLDRVASNDFSLEAEVLAQSGEVGFVGLVFGRKSLQSFHALVLFPPRPASAAREGLSSAGWVDLASFFGDNSSKTWRHTSIPAPLSDTETTADGTWHKLRVDVVGSVVDAWVDDQWIATQSFDTRDVLAGGFGLIAGPGQAQFRELRFLSRAEGDPTSAVQRALRLESLPEGATAIADSYVGAVPPWPKVARWVQGERKGWKEAGPVPQLLVLWSTDQNERVAIDAWLGDLAREHAEVGLSIVSIASPNDSDALAAYLAEHPFPGAVGIDLREHEGFGETNEAYSTPRFHLPRLILLDIDQRAVWEGDPGFRAAEGYRSGQGSYLDAPLDDLIRRRKLRSLGPWLARWQTIAAPALAAGDFETALPILRESFDFDATLIEAAYGAQQAAMAVESAIVSLASTAERLQGREPALGVLLAWAEMLELEVPKDAAASVRALRSAPASKDWERAKDQVGAWKKRIEKDLAQAEELAVRLEELAGAFPRELAAEVRAAHARGDQEALLEILESAPGTPRAWLAHRFFGW